MSANTKANKCQFCGRVLSDPMSLAQGAGDTCAQKRASFLSSAGIEASEIEKLREHTAPEVQRWVRVFDDQLKKKNVRGVKDAAKFAALAASRANETTNATAESPAVAA